MKDIGFGKNAKQEGIWDEYFNQWVTIRVPGIPVVYAGRIYGIKGGEYAVLSPFQDGYFNKERGFISRMSSGRALVPLVGSGIETTTKKNIENYCKYQNKKSREERQETKKKAKKELEKSDK